MGKEINSSLSLETQITPLLPIKSEDVNQRLPYARIILCQVGAAIAIYLMRLCAKISMSYGVSVNEFLFSRGVILVLLSAVVFPSTGHNLSNVIKTSGRTLLVRGFSGFFANMFFNYSITRIDLSMASTLFNTYPLFAVLIGALFFKESVSRLQVLSLLITFLGLLLLTFPCIFTVSCQSDQPVDIYMLFPLIGSISMALAMAGIRNCKHFHWIIPSGALGLLYVTLCPFLIYFVDGHAAFNFVATLVMICGGLSGCAVNFLVATGLRMGNLSFNTPLGYIGVLLSTVGDIVLFDVDIQWNQYAGALVIFIGIVCTTIAKYKHDQELTKVEKIKGSLQEIRESVTRAVVPFDSSSDV